jgi:hypothetical protein
LRRYDCNRPIIAVISPFNAIAEFGEKNLEFIRTAMNVADDIEGPWSSRLSVHGAGV